ncbi:hypothetical protein L211DRAFT_840812 [Terfezia boudieri ATCC MYA-4762]|uniref:Uncharacterized protein n=1 Tax=Terfezia boudieri ATCC MYA-4762 TaxID=1051890 RepID=A0A3N4LF88_9PEZI|nr:hypothetical protein L211DRAFT_840812 [Terfezia boudieri ATCC MYA-4762]
MDHRLSPSSRGITGLLPVPNANRVCSVDNYVGIFIILCGTSVAVSLQQVVYSGRGLCEFEEFAGWDMCTVVWADMWPNL